MPLMLVKVTGGSSGGGGPSGEGDSSDVGECEGGGVHQERVMALLLAKAREGGGAQKGVVAKTD